MVRPRAGAHRCEGSERRKHGAADPGREATLAVLHNLRNRMEERRNRAAQERTTTMYAVQGCARFVQPLQAERQHISLTTRRQQPGGIGNERPGKAKKSKQ